MASERTSQRGGFTLLEATVSLVILSLVGLAALGAVDRDLDAAIRSRTALESSALAADRLEAVRLVDAAGIASLPDSIAHGRFGPPFEAYSWNADARAVPGAPGLYDVRIEVTWTGGTRSLETWLYRSVPLSPGATP
ncbi:MAG: type II secretion system protein [Gemmatimonadota bacterium]